MTQSLESGSLYLDSRDKLINALYDAGEIEHQLLLQYLYAAVSLKREPDERCSPSKIEFIRRWNSVLHMVARQEMAHMALIANILSGMGAPPSFDRQNIIPKGLISPYFLAENLASKSNCAAVGEPVNIPFSLERFDLRTIRRFVCFENPKYNDQAADYIPRWCYHTSSGQWSCTPQHLSSDVPVGHSYLDSTTMARMQAAQSSSGCIGLVQVLYRQIRRAIRTLPDLFANPLPQVPIRGRYHIYVIPVTDRDKADTALELVIKQGESVYTELDYNSHFVLLYDICEDLTRLLDEDPDFEPARPFLSNPTPAQITEPFTLAVFELSQFAYLTLLFALTALYRNYIHEERTRYPFFSEALGYAVLTPLMVMVLRSLSEVLACLDVGDGVHTIGPSFTITPEARELLAPKCDNRAASVASELLDIDFHRDRCQHIRDRLRELADNVPAKAPPQLRQTLEHLFQRTHRLTLDMVQIYQNGKPMRLMRQ